MEIINKKEKLKKDNEIKWIEHYYNNILNREINILKFQGNHPDVLVREDNEVIAFELTCYTKNLEEVIDVEYRANVEKYLNYDLLINIYQRVSKKETQPILIKYRNKEQMIKEITKAEQLLEYVKINNNYWMIGNDCIIIKDFSIDSKSLVEYLRYFDDSIEEGESIEITFIKKNGISLELNFKYNKCFYQEKDVEIEKTYIGSHDEIEIMTNIKSAIIKKIKKFKKNVKHMNHNKSLPKKYKLFVHPIRTSASINADKLYYFLIDRIENILFDEVIIILFNKVLIINNISYRVI